MIPIVFISDENFVMQTHIAIRSLILNKAVNTEYDIYVVLAECSESKKKELKVLETEQVKVNFIDTSLEEFRDIKQLAHIPIACLLKFKVCDFIKNYDKIIYLDGDIYVRGDLTKLYNCDIQEYYAAAVPSLETIFNHEKRINAGIMLFNAKKMRDDCMSNQLIAVRKELGDRGSMDQQTFNLLMSEQMTTLPCEYNCIPHKIIGAEKNVYKIEDLNKLYQKNYKNKKEMVDKAIIIHYATGGKPWRYTYIPCSKEWYECYKCSIYGKIKLRRDTKLQAHMKGFLRVLKNKGIKGVVSRVKYYTIDRNKIDEISNDWG